MFGRVLPVNPLKSIGAGLKPADRIGHRHAGLKSPCHGGMLQVVRRRVGYASVLHGALERGLHLRDRAPPPLNDVRRSRPPPPATEVRRQPGWYSHPPLSLLRLRLALAYEADEVAIQVLHHPESRESVQRSARTALLRRPVASEIGLKMSPHLSHVSMRRHLHSYGLSKLQGWRAPRRSGHRAAANEPRSDNQTCTSCVRSHDVLRRFPSNIQEVSWTIRSIPRSAPRNSTPQP